MKNATTTGTCPRCGNPWAVGDEIVGAYTNGLVLEAEWGHRFCPRPNDYTPPVQDLIESYVRLGRNDESRDRREAAVRALSQHEADLRDSIATEIKAERDAYYAEPNGLNPHEDGEYVGLTRAIYIARGTTRQDQDHDH